MKGWRETGKYYYDVAEGPAWLEVEVIVSEVDDDAEFFLGDDGCPVTWFSVDG